MTVRVGDVGRPIILWAKFDLSGNTSLSMVFTKTDGTKLTVTSPDVTAPAVPLIDPILGTIPANEYFQYITKAGDIDQEGDWSRCGVYEDAAPTFKASASFEFEVLPGCA